MGAEPAAADGPGSGSPAAVVEEPGDYSVRGGLIDVFSPLYSDPLRMEFFGDMVESIHFFSATSQRRIQPLIEAILLPAREAVLKPENRSALINSGFDFPARRITVNLAPADLPKEGSRFDLPIALGILAASGQADDHRFEEFEFIGELSLSGKLKPVRGILPVAIRARAARRGLVVPVDCGAEAALAGGKRTYCADSLLSVVGWLRGVMKPEQRVATEGANSVLPLA